MRGLNNFKHKALLKHNGLYSYNKIKYVNSKTNVIIECKEHGEFSQRPDHHLQGSGCQKCSGCYHMTQEEYIKDCTIIHGGVYDYDNIKFRDMKSMLNILCLNCMKHFIQRADAHRVMEQGCPRCNSKTQHSKEAIKWLETLRPQYSDLQHAKNGGEFIIPGSTYKADGYSEKYNVIFEYHGAFWHGCRYCYSDRNEINPRSGKTVEQAYQDTKNKMHFIMDQGYELYIEWSCGHIDNFDD